ncbi:hypothetical protein BA898_10055 [Spiribacter roseus]|nr:hypothetical protein BA898_10055 [Spiribacter roseus]
MPLRTVLVVMLTLVALVSSILAFLLPLKIIILLGSEGMPKYFPPAFERFDRDRLVVYLSLATVGLFLLNVVAVKVTAWITEGATQSLLARSRKLVLFENQHEVAGNAYQSFSSVLAGGVFTALGLAAILVFYSELGLVIAGYLALVTVVLALGCARSLSVRKYVQGYLNAVVGNLSTLGFFVVFGYLVLDFVLLEPPNFLVAIISFLLTRQILTRLSGVVTGLDKLYRQREKLDALFFHGRPFVQAAQDKLGSLWDQLAPGQKGHWVAPLLNEYAGLEGLEPEAAEQALSWQQPSLPQMGAFVYRGREGVFLAKLYDQKKSMAAQHAATLLADAPEGLPAPGFLGLTQTGVFPCAAYQLVAGSAVPAKQARKVAIDVKAQLLALEPPSELAARYLRSRPTVAQRMNTQWLDRALVAANRKAKKAITALWEHWMALQSIVSALPLTFQNPDMKPWALWQPENAAAPMLLNWEKWSLEPAGVGWVLQGKGSQQLAAAHEQACEKRKALRDFPVEHLMLAALVAELERFTQKQLLGEAAGVIVQIWRVLKPLRAAEPATSEKKAANGE